MQNRAYSFITIKSFDEDTRIIEGVATTPSTDRMGDVVNPLGAKFALPLPFLWQHNHEEPIGHVIEATPTAKGIKFKAQIAKTDEPGKLKDLLDFAWQCIKMKLVAAVSIGFRPIKYAFLSEGGVEFDEWDWFELSAVTVPAQIEATITSVKSIDAGLRKAAGVPEPDPIPANPKDKAAPGKNVRVVKLAAPARDRAPPFVIRRIVRV
jgi:HK97 family phage prohead protease